MAGLKVKQNRCAEFSRPFIYAPHFRSIKQHTILQLASPDRATFQRGPQEIRDVGLAYVGICKPHKPVGVLRYRGPCPLVLSCVRQNNPFRASASFKVVNLLTGSLTRMYMDVQNGPSPGRL